MLPCPPFSWHFDALWVNVLASDGQNWQKNSRTLKMPLGYAWLC